MSNEIYFDAGVNGQELYPIKDGYYVSRLGYFFTDKRNNVRRLTDFILTTISRELVKYVDGQQSEKLKIMLTNDYGATMCLEVQKHEWMNLATIIAQQARGFQIFADEYPRAKEKFQRIVDEILKQQENLGRVQLLIVQNYWGWSDQMADGSRYFYEGSSPFCLSDKCFVPIPDEKMQKIFLEQSINIFHVGPLDMVAPLVIYGLASYMDAIFTDAGYPLEHCMMIIGSTGFLKTSFAKTIFSPFVRDRDKVFSVRGTEAAMNQLIEFAYDDTLVIDDFNLEGSKVEVQQKMKNIRALIRAFSDKTPRAKYGGKNGVKRSAVRGGCVFTAETKMLGQLTSSELRYLKVFFYQPLNGNELRFFQENPVVWQTMVSEFIKYLALCYSNMVNYVKSKFVVYRSQVQIRDARLVDACVHLQLVIEVFCWFLYFRQVLSPQHLEQLKYDLSCMILQLAAKQSEDAKDQEPYVKYLAELFNLIGTSDLQIAPSLDKYTQNLGFYVGYRDNGLLILKKDDAYNTVKTALLKRNDDLVASSDDISKQLKDANLTRYDVGSCLKKASSRIDGRPRMLALIESSCLQVVDAV